MIAMSLVLIKGALYTFTGVIAGLMSGMIGMGGGIIIVPALLFIFKHVSELSGDLAIHLASGTSLAIIFLISPMTVYSYYKRGKILWAVYRRLAAGIFIGTIIGVILSTYLPYVWLEKILAIFLFAVAIKMVIYPAVTSPKQHTFSLRLDRAVSLIIGLLSGLLGIGGGVFVVPYLSYCGIEMRKIVPISALCIMTIALVGTSTFIIAGLYEPHLPAYTTGYIYWPAVLFIAPPSMLAASLGVKLSYILSPNHLKYIFVTILLLTSIQLIL